MDKKPRAKVLSIWRENTVLWNYCSGGQNGPQLNGCILDGIKMDRDATGTLTYKAWAVDKSGKFSEVKMEVIYSLNLEKN